MRSTIRSLGEHRAPRHSTRLLPRSALAACLGVLAMLTVVTGMSPSIMRTVIAISITAAVLASSLLAPQYGVLTALVWLCVLGTVRRLLLLAGADSGNDPLLLVGPIVAGFLLVVAARRGAFRERTTLSNCVLALTMLLLVSALNPLQGSLAVGTGGLLFLFVPILWFWVGRGLVQDETLHRLLLVIGVVGVAVAIYGMSQVYRGFPPWDQAWIETRGYASLYIGTSLRQFASFTSAAEYVGLLSIALIIWALRIGGARRLWLAPFFVALITWALLLASVRGAIVVLVVTLGVLFAAARGFGIARTIAFGFAGLVALSLVVSRIDPEKVGGAQTGALLGRQVSGLSDPFNSQTSTLPVHLTAFTTGLQDAAHNVIGRGPGAVSIAADKFGGGSSSTDLDPSNVAIALGIPGLLVYLAVVGLGVRRAFWLAQTRRDLLALAALGILLGTAFQWLNGGNYAVAPIPWIFLGWVDRAGVSPAEALEAGS